MKTDEAGLTVEKWRELNVNGTVDNASEVFRLVYFGGVAPELRKEVWPYLLGHYIFGSTLEERKSLDETCKHYYETTMSEWLAVDAIVQQREKEKTARAVAKLSSGSNSGQERTVRHIDIEAGELENEVFEDISDISDPGDLEFEEEQKEPQQMVATSSTGHLMVKPIPRAMKTSTDSGNVDDNVDDLNNDEEDANAQTVKDETSLKEEISSNANASAKSTPSSSSYDTVGNGYVELRQEHLAECAASEELEPKSILSPDYLSADDFQDNLRDEEREEKENNKDFKTAVIVTNPSVDIVNWETSPKLASMRMSPVEEVANQSVLDALQEPKSACVSPASSNGGVYSVSFIIV